MMSIVFESTAKNCKSSVFKDICHRRAPEGQASFSALAGLLECVWAGPLALRCGQSGQVRKEAATANFRECRGKGSPTLIFACPIESTSAPE
jgi:hypothetical protein